MSEPITAEQCERDCAQYRGPCFAVGCPRALTMGLMTPESVGEETVRRLRAAQQEPQPAKPECLCEIDGQGISHECPVHWVKPQASTQEKA
jgi:hypothetical protein